MPTIKLMTDYGCFPIWRVDDNANVDPGTLPITKDLRSSLAKWAEWYDGILNQEDPARSGFANKEEEQAFEAEGRRLFQELQIQLGGSCKVVYFSTLDNRVHE